ncbi:Nif11-like leader peptide family natural product precursor [Solidesulfovibrio alcoholivorans]|uniref:Nif11-like leader peptide family natural product precursor n=1 Tax=Solidesulfovibrio alcoholivorans TaxID=81406 RepID=UPI000495AECD|nr:Nif11-like leader peptide family natural product precursor [Solidesulfovibrio alcoholivorans]
MTLDNVRRLYERFDTDKELRARLYAAEGPEGREAVLREAGLYFSDVEFDEMESVLHVKCQTHEQAERFFEFRDWWNFLRHSS